LSRVLARRVGRKSKLATCEERVERCQLHF
jgi:hypothetical protein